MVNEQMRVMMVKWEKVVLRGMEGLVGKEEMRKEREAYETLLRLVDENVKANQRRK